MFLKLMNQSESSSFVLCHPPSTPISPVYRKQMKSSEGSSYNVSVSSSAFRNKHCSLTASALAQAATFHIKTHTQEQIVHSLKKKNQKKKKKKSTDSWFLFCLSSCIESLEWWGKLFISRSSLLTHESTSSVLQKPEPLYTPRILSSLH